MCTVLLLISLLLMGSLRGDCRSFLRLGLRLDHRDVEHLPELSRFLDVSACVWHRRGCEGRLPLLVLLRESGDIQAIAELV
jgi:hypothetical protein